MKRRLTKLVICLLLGAVTTVAVAWSLSITFTSVRPAARSWRSAHGYYRWLEQGDLRRRLPTDCLAQLAPSVLARMTSPWSLAMIDGCLRFVLTNSSESGLLAVDTSHGPMYGHGFATLFLAEVYGMTHRAEVREALRKAVRTSDVAVYQEIEDAWYRAEETYAGNRQFLVQDPDGTGVVVYVFRLQRQCLRHPQPTAPQHRQQCAVALTSA